MNYKSAAAIVQSNRQAVLLDALAAFRQALQHNAQLLELEKKIRDIELNGVMGKKINKPQLQNLQKEKDKLLKQLHIELSPPPACPICQDTGYVGKQYCECVKKLAFSSNDSLHLALHDFDKSDLSLFSKDCVPLVQKVYGDVEKICTLYPANVKRNIVIMGPCGTGKTFLAGCAAKLMMDRGFSVTAVTAFDFVNRALNYHTSFDDKKLDYLSPLLDASLLIIDDLATESILKNITLEYLFLVINERTSKQLLTFISTNLNEQALQARYGERIYSRLFDSRLCYKGKLLGKDIRL